MTGFSCAYSLTANNSACDGPGYPQLVIDGQLPEVREAAKMVFDRGHTYIQMFVGKAAECACRRTQEGKAWDPGGERNLILRVTQEPLGIEEDVAKGKEVAMRAPGSPFMRCRGIMRNWRKRCRSFRSWPWEQGTVHQVELFPPPPLGILSLLPVIRGFTHIILDE